MKLNEETVSGRRVTMTTGTIISFHKNHSYSASGTFGPQLWGVDSASNAPVPGTARGRWEVRFGNTIYVTFEHGGSRFFHFWKDGEKLYFRASGGASQAIAKIEAID